MLVDGLSKNIREEEAFIKLDQGVRKLIEKVREIVVYLDGFQRNGWMCVNYLKLSLVVERGPIML
jgi:hypothetical protein